MEDILYLFPILRYERFYIYTNEKSAKNHYICYHLWHILDFLKSKTVKLALSNPLIFQTYAKFYEK